MWRAVLRDDRSGPEESVLLTRGPPAYRSLEIGLTSTTTVELLSQVPATISGIVRVLPGVPFIERSKFVVLMVLTRLGPRRKMYSLAGSP